MAEALVIIALKVVGQQLIDVVGPQLSLFAGTTRELQKLSDTFRSIQAVLDDAESRQVSEKPVQLWLSRLRHAAYDVEELLEDASNHDVSRYNVPRRIKGRYNVARRIKKIRKRLDQINDERNRFGFSSSPMDGDHRMLVRSHRQTTSLMDESEIIGRKNDKETMISRLVSGSSRNEKQGQVQAIAIAGIGGLGKTTLARLIYHDAKVRDHFNQDLYWVCVSEPFDVFRLTKDIIEEVKKGPPTCSNLNGLQDELLQLLRRKRYLLVLDDVWNDDASKWEKLRLPLISGANGSRILVTTRSEKVANTMNANYIHELKGLSDDQSWTLFSSKAFAGKGEGDCSEFESIGKGIVNKCKGVPLSIKVTGSAMNTKRNVKDWKNVLDSQIWSLQQGKDEIIPALLLTYCHLPTHLKQCFVYCSIFPKDWHLEKDTLVRLWVAQDFIQSEGNREKEDIGEEYFDELVARSIFQQVQQNYKGKITCKMHDLLHDLAKFIANDEIYCSEGGKSEESSSGISNVRHAFLSFIGNDDNLSNIPIAFSIAKKVRTLWLNRISDVDGGIASAIAGSIQEARFLRALYFPSTTRCPKIICKLKHLTYLHLPSSKMVKLPDAIGKMQQLSYLDLSESDIVELPESVGDLCNLHTLNLYSCGKLEKLPRGIGKMVSLRDLKLSYSAIVELPESMRDLHNLLKLELTCCVRLEKLPRGIGGMVNLRDLDLSDLRIVELPESVGDLRNLHTLNLSHCEMLEKLPRGIGEMVSLRDLDLSSSAIVELPESVGNLYNLDTLDLMHCKKLKKLPRSIGRMVSLRDLGLSFSTIVELPESVGDLRNLPTLDLSRCKMLEKIPRGIGEMVSLRELDLCLSAIVELPESVGDLRNLHTLNLSYCEMLEKLPRSIGRMVSLRDLNLSCSAIVELPESMGDLCNLHTLELSVCKLLKKLPRGIGRMVSLRDLDLSQSAIVELPESVGDLRNLHTLNLRDCNMLEKLPRGIGRMVSLRELNLDYSAAIVELPESVGDLCNLHTLSLYYCKKLEKLPRGISGMVSLRDLDLTNSAIVELPESVGDLHNLHTLNLSHCGKLKKLPRGIGRMVSLRDLDLSYNSNIVELPESVGKLRNLDTLNLDRCQKLEKLPRDIGEMVNLRRLKIAGIDRLKYLPKGLGRISRLLCLDKFIVGGGDEGEGCGIDELQSLNSLQGTLRIVHLERVSSREEAEKAELWKKQHLRRLDLWMSAGRHDDVATERIDGVLEGLRPHENLQRLHAHTGSKLPSWMDEMLCLRKLALSSNLKLERLPHLSSLKKFEIRRVRNEILPDEGWEQLMALQKLKIFYCEELKCLPEGLGELTALIHLEIRGCGALASLPQRLRHLSLLQTLKISNCPLLTERCKREGGVDRPNISHIPTITIDGQVIISDWDLDSDSDSGVSSMCCSCVVPLVRERRKRKGRRGLASHFPAIIIEDDPSDLDSDWDSEASTIVAAPLDDDAHERSEEVASDAAPLDDEAHEGSEEEAPDSD